MQNGPQVSSSVTEEPPANDLVDVQRGHANDSNVTNNKPFLVTDIHETCDGKVKAENTV